MIPGKLYQHLDSEHTKLYEQISFNHIKTIKKDDVVFVIEKSYNTFRVLAADGTIGIIYFYFCRWKEL
jgi:hypothetical protein